MATTAKSNSDTSLKRLTADAAKAAALAEVAKRHVRTAKTELKKARKLSKAAKKTLKHAEKKIEVAKTALRHEAKPAAEPKKAAAPKARKKVKVRASKPPQRKTVKTAAEVANSVIGQLSASRPTKRAATPPLHSPAPAQTPMHAAAPEPSA